MTIKDQLADLFKELNKPQPEIKLARVAANLAALAADLEEHDVEIPADVLEPLDNDTRKAALVAVLGAIGQALQN